jgi:5'-nucleotidase
MKLKILHTNDLHSKFEELARIACAIEELRDENTLILDAGDNADFSRPEAEGTNGRISSAILNEIGYTAKVFGNNEGFAGKENARIISLTSHCPVVTCNMCDMKGKRLDFLEDAIIVDFPRLRILIIGVTAPINVFFHLYGIHVKDPEREVRRVLAEHKKTPRDLTILVSHLGLVEDRNLASKLPNIDVIVGGHSHTFLEKPLLENNTIICQAGHFGQCLGELTVELDATTKKICNYEGRLIRSRKYPENPKIKRMIEQFTEQADKYLSREMYSINKSLDHSLTEENAVGNLLADALRDLVKAEIGIINSGAVNGGISKGAITKKLLHELSPSPLNPTYMEMKGRDIESALKKSMTPKYQLSNGHGAGFRGSHLGNLQVSNNIQVRVDSKNKLGMITVDNRPLDPRRWYSVATSDYLQRGTGYQDFAKNRNERYRPELLRNVLEKYLKKPEFLKRAFTKRFKRDCSSRQVSG